MNQATKLQLTRVVDLFTTGQLDQEVHFKITTHDVEREQDAPSTSHETVRQTTEGEKDPNEARDLHATSGQHNNAHSQIRKRRTTKQSRAAKR